MSVLSIPTVASHSPQSIFFRSPKFFRGPKAFGIVPAIALLLCTSLLVALETPSKPFLEKNSFYLSSSGFRVQLANDPAGKKAMHALPVHRFVVHHAGGEVRYLYAEPQHCSCVFIGTAQAYNTYRNMISAQSDQPDYVSADYKSQIGTLLNSNPVALETLDNPGGLAAYFNSVY
jgi:hypothetical protein